MPLADKSLIPESASECADVHRAEVAGGQRFEFGANWARFLEVLDDERIRRAEESLAAMLGRERLDGITFLDVGCGSGLFSLAARRLGARVTSFDYDPRSVSCTLELRKRYFRGDDAWTVEIASILDGDYIRRLGMFDAVYSWGVLHHTGAMWQALDNAARLVAAEGIFFLAIYNDQGRASGTWRAVKRAYNRLPRGVRLLVLLPAFARLWGPTLLRDSLKLKPLATWKGYAREGRGMSPWRDVVDWVGGFPFEVARPEEVFDFMRARGFSLSRLKTCGGGLGCNEFVFERKA